MAVVVTVFIVVTSCFLLNASPLESKGIKAPVPRKKFYINSSARINWYAAYFECLKNNSQLANIETAEDHQDMINLIENSELSGERFWLGGSDVAKEGEWVWSNGKRMRGFSFWAPNKPGLNREGLVLEDCLAVWKTWSYDWNDYECPMLMYSICEEKPAIRPISYWPPPGAVEKKFYLELNIKVDWHSAYMYCLRNNSRLARIENKEENDIVVAMIKEANLGFDLEYWLGATDFPEVGLYFWLSTGTPVRGYSNWHAGQGMAEDQRCLTYWQSSKHVVRWNDFICTTLYPFVCEYYD